MLSAKEETPVRLQVPIHKMVAAELEKYAKGFDRPVSWMARELLKDSVDREESFLAWLTFRTVGYVLGNKREKLQSKYLPDCSDGEIVRVQVNISESLADNIEELAKKQFRPTSNMASLLLVRALDDEAWMVNFIQSKYSAPLRALVTPAKESKKRKNRKAA